MRGEKPILIPDPDGTLAQPVAQGATISRDAMDRKTNPAERGGRGGGDVGGNSASNGTLATSNKTPATTKPGNKKKDKVAVRDLTDENIDMDENETDETLTKSLQQGHKRGSTADFDGDDAETGIRTGSNSEKKTKRVVTGVASSPKGSMLKYSTEFYTLYDPKLSNKGLAIDKPFSSFGVYDNYTLFMNPFVDQVDDIPLGGVRLDDMTVAFVINNCAQKQLKERWPAEFDTHAMVRGRRLPLGHAAKEFKREGDKDIDGNVLTKDQEGWFYMWYKGLHELSGQEGLNHKTYKKRPAFEKIRCSGLTWKITSRANVQMASGDPRDPTFSALDDYPTYAHPASKQGATTASSIKSATTKSATSMLGASGGSNSRPAGSDRNIRSSSAP